MEALRLNQTCPQWRRYRHFAVTASLLATSFVRAQSGVPTIQAGGVVNAAKYSAELAPGSMASVFGQNLAEGTTAASEVPLPATIAGVSVEIIEAGKPAIAAPLYFVSPGQINFQVPFNVATGTVQVRVRNARGVSNAASVAVSRVAPAIFTVDASGTGDALAINAQDFSLKTSSRPAVPGEYLALLVTGLGQVTPAAVAGRPGGDNDRWGPLNHTVVKPRVYLGSQEVTVIFSGLMPRFAGVYQINVQVPQDLAPGLYPVVVVAEGASSQGHVAIPCGRSSVAFASQVVGPSGGTVAAGGLEVQIPSGVFSSAASVAIARSQDPQPGGSAQISDVFVVRGLPAELRAPVTVKIPLREAPPPDVQTLVAMDSGRGVQGSGVEYLEAVVEGNVARVVLPAAESSTDSPRSWAGKGEAVSALVGDPAGREASGPEVSFYVTTSDGQFDTAAGHFRIFYPKDDPTMEQKARAVGDALEESYKKLEGLGLSWQARTRWPIRVVITPLTGDLAERWGQAEPSILGKNHWSITLNATKLAAGGVTNEVRATAGHELFHVLQDLYDPRIAYRIAKFPNAWLWFWEAASTWFESEVLNDPGYIAPTVDANCNFLTARGLEFPPGNAADVQNHGYGASMFLRYLAQRAGATSVGEVVKLASLRAPGLLADSAWGPVRSMDSVYMTIGAKWVDFVESYVDGRIYPSDFPSKAHLLSQVAGRYQFSRDADTGTLFTWTSPNLSARVFVIKMSQAWPDNTVLTLSFESAGDYVRAFVYSARGSTWRKVGSFSPSQPLRIDNAEQFQKDGADLVVVVADGSGTSKYLSSNETRLRILKGGDLLRILQQFKKIYHKIYGNISGDASGTTMGTFNTKSPVVWRGRAFSLETQDSDLVASGEPPYDLRIEGEVSQEGRRLEWLSYRRTRKYERTYKDSAGRDFYDYQDRVYAWTVRNIPLTSDPDRLAAGMLSTARFELRGPSVTLEGFTCITRYWHGEKKDFTPDKIRTATCTITMTGSSHGTETLFSK